MRRGADVRDAVAASEPALVVLDLQIGNMGGMAACMDLRLEAGAGRLPDVAVLMLLDREADVFLAQRSDADGWLIKPLDAFRLRRAATALLAGGDYHEGVPERPRSGSARGGSAIPRSAVRFSTPTGWWRSLVSALRSGRRGREFKSPPPDHCLFSSEPLLLSTGCGDVPADHTQTTSAWRTPRYWAASGIPWRPASVSPLGSGAGPSTFPRPEVSATPAIAARISRWCPTGKRAIR